MTTTEMVLQELEVVYRALVKRDQRDLAWRVGKLIGVLRNGTSSEPVGDLMTTKEAAKLLDIDSNFAVSRWARDGILEAYSRDGRLVVSKRSVERLRDSPMVVQEREWERKLDEALAPFDLGDEPTPPTGMAWIGRKPWETDARRDD